VVFFEAAVPLSPRCDSGAPRITWRAAVSGAVGATKMGQIFKPAAKAISPTGRKRIVGSATSQWQRDERFFVAKNFSQSVS
jgi:hypothetical protein